MTLALSLALDWVGGGVGTGGDVPIYEGGEEEDDEEEDDEVLAATSLAVSLMLAAGDAVGLLPAVAVAAGSAFALGLRPRLAGSLGDSSS